MHLFSNIKILLISFVTIVSIWSHVILASNVDFDPISQDIPAIDKNFPPSFHEVFIPVNDYKLTGFILQANGKGPHPTAVLLHGLPGNEKNLDLAQSLRRAGFNVLFFHYSGAWGSQGDYSFSGLHKDVLAAFAFLRKNAEQYLVDIEKISVVGHSFGGYAALRSGSIDDNLSCVVGLSAANPAVIAQSSRVAPKGDENIGGFGGYIDSLFMLNNTSGKKATEEIMANIKEMDTRDYGKALVGKNILLVVGEQDSVTPAALQKDLLNHYQKVPDLKVESHIIAGDHAFSYSRIKLQKLVVYWMINHCL
ncbi:MAG: alpha/beta hydrolase [Gammaproteobacteria bacterium]|nr:MAG: alpha/beta hydrolase [Gammaproteobacteria bacterium]